MTDYHATQATGRSSAVVHPVAALDRRPEPGTVATIQYRDGRGRVQEKQQELKRQVERCPIGSTMSKAPFGGPFSFEPFPLRLHLKRWPPSNPNGASSITGQHG